PLPIAGPPERLVGGRIVGAGHPDGAAARLPRIGVALPGLAAGLTRRWNGELAPKAFAGGGIECADPVAYALVAVGGPDDELVLDGERRRRECHVRRIREGGFPHHLAGLLVGGNDPWRRDAGARDDEIAPQGGAAVAKLAFLLRVHPPHDPAGITRGGVDLVEHAPRVRDVEESVLHERRRHRKFVAGAAAERDRIGELEVLDIVPADASER